jgi:DivIVA domain-containing protein
MKDSQFHLTPVDIRAQEFRRSLRGFDPSDVEEFRQRVASELERLLRERADTEDTLRALREQLRSFQDREKALNDALVLSQQLRADTEQAALRQAELSERETRAEAENILREARAEERQVRRDIEAAQRQFASYLAGFRTLLERYLSEVDALESHEQDGGASRSTP